MVRQLTLPQLFMTRHNFSQSLLHTPQPVSLTNEAAATYIPEDPACIDTATILSLKPRIFRPFTPSSFSGFQMSVSWINAGYD
jgi:hypothetical protein